MDYPQEQFTVSIYDNGLPMESSQVAVPFQNRLRLRYTVNEPGHGLGYSLERGLRECPPTGYLVELNDDALVPPDFLHRLRTIFESDPKIGVVGVRAIEDQYYSHPTDSIGTIALNGEVIGNFDRVTDGPVDVEHVYGFCYVYTREVVDRGGRHDKVLLTKDYSSGNRLETDHCLTARQLGFRVVYDGRIAVRHLAKPRADMCERSLRWKLNDTRNTLYLYLKHFGLFGKKALALRYTCIRDVGLISALRRPTKANWQYFFTGLHARGSAYFHYFRHLLGGNASLGNHP